MLKLYGHPLSGHTHKVRLLLAELQVPYEETSVEIPGGNEQPEFLKLNPLGEVPVLVDGEIELSDSQAILVYLARRERREDLLPTDPAAMGRIVRWLSVAANEIHHGPNMARLHCLFGVDADLALAQRRAHAIIGFIITICRPGNGSKRSA